MRDTTRFPDRTHLLLPPGTLDRVHEAARRAGTSGAEVMRQAILRTLELAPEVPKEDPATRRAA